MRGSPKRQAKALVAMLKQYGKSKHEAKRKQVTNGRKTNVNQRTGIFSYNTAMQYQSVYCRFLTWACVTHGITDAVKITPVILEEWLLENVSRNITYNTLQTDIAAMEKMPKALESVGIKPDPAWRNVIADCRVFGKKTLVREHRSRALRQPYRVVQQLHGMSRIAAELQLKCGCRISEISELKLGRNILEKNRLTLTNTKGGLVRTVEVPINLYERLMVVVHEKGEFKIDRRAYAMELKRAAKQHGERWTGTHALRWNYARNKMFELEVREGLSFDEARYVVSRTLGHRRPEISEWYLR